MNEDLILIIVIILMAYLFATNNYPPSKIRYLAYTFLMIAQLLGNWIW